jgi:hypothetical protein
MFKLDDKQSEKFDRWRTEQDEKVATAQGNKIPYYGAIGGAYTFSFTPTTLGTVVTITNGLTNDKIDLTKYDEW